jgi:integrase
MPPWTLHDLRRTARSLMSRAKVPTDHAERVIGHVIGGVRETYDRYEYLHEKRDALEKLAGLVDLILNPPADNVVAMPDRQAETG